MTEEKNSAGIFSGGYGGYARRPGEPLLLFCPFVRQQVSTVWLRVGHFLQQVLIASRWRQTVRLAHRCQSGCGTGFVLSGEKLLREKNGIAVSVPWIWFSAGEKEDIEDNALRECFPVPENMKGMWR